MILHSQPRVVSLRHRRIRTISRLRCVAALECPSNRADAPPVSARPKSITIRTEAAFLSAVVAGAWLATAMLGMSAPTSARATSLAQAAPNGASLLEAAHDARRRRDLADADRLYRLAWRDVATRARAAESLHALESDGLEAPVDEEQVEPVAQQLGAAFRRFESDHFVMLSDAPRSTAQAKLEALERTHHQYFRAMDRLGFHAIPAPQKLLCILFADHAMYRAFASAQDGVDAAWVAGYYAGLSNRAVFYEDESGPSFTAATQKLADAERRVRELEDQATQARRDRRTDEAQFIAAKAEQLSRQIASERARLDTQARHASIAKTIHEAVHLLAFNTGLQSRAHQYPFWITEGLATSFETDRPHAAFGPDRPAEAREEELARAVENDRLVSLESLVSALQPPDDNDQITESMYAQSWSLFGFLHRTERRSLSSFFDDMLDEPAGAMTDDRRLALFEEHFGDVDRVERRWIRYIKQSMPAVAQALQE